jgi:preprotein translocase subunit SecG
MKRKRVSTSEKRSSVLSRVTFVLILSVVIGAITLAFFKVVFPYVAARSVLTVIALFSLILSIALDNAWNRRKRKRRDS